MYSHLTKTSKANLNNRTQFLANGYNTELFLIFCQGWTEGSRRRVYRHFYPGRQHSRHRLDSLQMACKSRSQSAQVPRWAIQPDSATAA